MTFQVESPKITEIQVRMDCNGCVQKIRKALQSVQGIYETHEDFPQQKIIVVGWADPEKLMKAIKRAGKIAKLCSHTEVEKPKTEERVDAAEAAPAPATTVTEAPTEQNNQTATEQTNKPPEEAPPPENKPPEEAPPPPPPAEAPPPEAPPPADPKPQENPETPPPPSQEAAAASDPPVPSEPYYINVHPRHEYVVRDGFYGYHMGTQEYMMRYNYPDYVDHQRRYQRDPYYYGNNNGRSTDGYATVFSDENPNSCCIA